MIHSISGKLTSFADTFVVVDCHGVGFQVFVSDRTKRALTPQGIEVTLFTFLYVRESQMELYGFHDEESLCLFELLNSVAGVGPKTALGILEVDTVSNIIAAIIEKRVDILTHTSGVGRKTAERIILELQNRVSARGAAGRTKGMDAAREVEDALVGLGYRRDRVRQVLEGMEKSVTKVEDKLKNALKELGRKI